MKRPVASMAESAGHILKAGQRRSKFSQMAEGGSVLCRLRDGAEKRMLFL